MNKNQFEEYMNNIYTEEFGCDQDYIIEMLGLGYGIKRDKAIEYYKNKTVGTIIRKYDNKLFEQLYDENK